MLKDKVFDILFVLISTNPTEKTQQSSGFANWVSRLPNVMVIFAILNMLDRVGSAFILELYQCTKNLVPIPAIAPPSALSYTSILYMTA